MEPLTEAIRCGIPIYTACVRMLRDSTNFFRDLHHGDERFEEYSRKAHSVAAAANIESTLRCLRLGLDLTAKYVSE
jgi:hypothetical protein